MPTRSIAEPYINIVSLYTINAEPYINIVFLYTINAERSINNASTYINKIISPNKRGKGDRPYLPTPMP